MTACTQPGCTGAIVDGYCDVCGSPVGAVPFVPKEAAAPAGSPARADEPALTAVGPGSGSPPKPKNAVRETACTQPGCTGTIVDGYCDVCGSPVGAVPFVPTKAAAPAGSPARADEPALTAVGPGSGFPPKPKTAGRETACTQPGCTGMIVDCYCDVCGSPAAGPLVPAKTAASARDEEIPIQRTTQQLSTQETADPVAADPAAVDVKKVVREKELANNETDGAQDYRTRVEEAQLPDDVREEALREVGKLERTIDKSPESDDIRNWLDTMLDLPWSTKIMDSIDIQGSREVEATLQSLIKPAVADLGEADTAETEAAVADLEEADTAETEAMVADLEEADTAETEAMVADLEEADTAETEAMVADLEEADREKELADNETDGARDYRTRVEEAQLPDDVREAALREVGKLERTSDQSPEADDIRSWLDTMLDLPWSTKIMDSIDIQGSHEVEATLQRLIEPVVADLGEADTAEAEAVVADVEEGDTAGTEAMVADLEEGDTAGTEAMVADLEDGDTAETEPAAADVENVDRASAGPHDDDTVETSAVLAGFSGRGHPVPQLPEQQIVGRVLVKTPTEKRRFRSLALAATALAVLLIGALVLAAGRDRGVTAQSAPTVTATATATVSKPTSEPSDESTGTGGEESTIQLEDLPESGRPFQTVRIQGRFRSGADTLLRVQRWEGGKWLDFPLTTKTDQSGKFTTYVELGGRPGRYLLRVLDSDSLVTSEPFVVVIKG
jgi:hypothetical protein